MLNDTSSGNDKGHDNGVGVWQARHRIVPCVVYNGFPTNGREIFLILS
jgi:hypothetical protein